MASAETVAGSVSSFNSEVDKPREECGVWAIWDPNGSDLLARALAGLHAIQHRGEDGAGLAVISPSNGDFSYVRGPGTVAEVFGEDGAALAALPRDAIAANGHTRYGTDRSNVLVDGSGPRVYSEAAVAHNGQLTNKLQLATEFGIDAYVTDSDLAGQIINKVALEQFNGDVERATLTVLPKLEGAFSFTILTRDKLIAARDRHGIRPLQLGITETGGYAVASEVKALEEIDGVWHEREIEPGEMVVISNDGIRSGIWSTEVEPAACSLEFFYLANKETVINGQRVGDVRQHLGVLAWQSFVAAHPEVMDRALYGESESDAIVVPIPNGGNQVGHGFAHASGLPEVHAFKKNPAYGRSFLQPTTEARVAVAEQKQILDGALVEGRVVIALDDSLVRGTSARANVTKLREAGAKEVHLVLGSPAVVGTCELGVDIPTHQELIASRNDGDLAKMAAELGADSVTFVSVKDSYDLLGKKVCMQCFDGPGPNVLSVTPEQAGEPLVPVVAAVA